MSTYPNRMTFATNKTDIKELTLAGLQKWLSAQGTRPFHANQILRWLYRRQVDDFSRMTDLALLAAAASAPSSLPSR